MKNKNKYAQLVSTLLLFGIGSISCQSQTHQKFNDNKRTRICQHDTMYYASKQSDGTWQQQGGAGYTFNGFGQMTNVNATDEQRQEATKLIEDIK